MSTAIRNILIFLVGGGGGLQASESDFYRPQILTYKDGPALKGVKRQILNKYGSCLLTRSCGSR